MKICVIGVGNIGLRYVQGVTAKFPDAQLFLVDNSLRLAELAEMELGNATYVQSVEDIDVALDICVVSTSCEPRLEIYRRCLELKPRYIILEKYLFSSRQQFEECLALDRVPTFVNQWLYGSRAFDCMFQKDASSVELRGSSWGLACNAVHWIDVFQRHMQIDQLQVDDQTRITSVFPSKRPGYEEIYGELNFVDRDSDKTIRLIDAGDASLAGVMQIRVDGKVFDFDYTHISSNGEVLSRFPYFSEIFGDIAATIVDSGTCHLPRLEDSVEQHLLLEEIFETLERRPTIT